MKLLVCWLIVVPLIAIGFAAGVMWECLAVGFSAGQGGIERVMEEMKEP
jgi:hypothetical protein